MCFAGCAIGLPVAWLVVERVIRHFPSALPRSGEIAIDGVTLAVAVVVALASGAVLGFVPFLVAPVNLGVLREGTFRVAGTQRANRALNGLVAGEIALAVGVIVCAGLLVQSFRNLEQSDAGFDPSEHVTFSVVLPPVNYPTSDDRLRLFRRLLDDLSTVPGVQSVSAMRGLPPLREIDANDTEFERPGSSAVAVQTVDYYQITTRDYFKTQGIRVRAGRDFQAADGPESNPVVLVNYAFARRLLPGQSAIGQRVRPGSEGLGWFTIVGVVDDVKQGGLREQPGTELYFLVDQAKALGGYAPRNMNVVVRSRLPVRALAPSIGKVVAAIDPSLPVVRLRSMQDVFAETIAREHVAAEMLLIFSVLAIAMAAVGIYGTIAYTVAANRREIGIRMALGATPSSILRMILWQVIRLTAVGIVVGLLGAIALARLAASTLYGVAPMDVTALSGAALTVVGVALASAAIPAMSALRVMPAISLRSE